MAAKENGIGLANDAASLIIREIGEKHFRQPPDGAFTVNDMMRHYPTCGEGKVRTRLDKLVDAGELKAGRFGFKKFYWKS